jgi:hypothetical protein
MQIRTEQRPLVAAMLALLLIGCGLALTAGQTWAEIRFNLGIELLGTAVAVLLIDLVVTRHLERREELRRLPILQTIAVRLEELVKRLVEHLELLGVEVKSDVGSAVELAQLISPEKVNEKIETAPGHFVPRIVQFQAATSFDIAHLRE